MKWLVHHGKKIPLTGKALQLGRDDGCEVKLDEAIASRKHASLVERDNGYVLVDHESRNGTFVNGKRVKGSIELHHKDSIWIGKTEMLYTEWTPTPGSMSRSGRSNDFALSTSTVASSSGSATNTGAKLICSVLYRSLDANDNQAAERIISAVSQRIAKRTQTGELELNELDVVAPAFVRYSHAVQDVRWLPWLLSIYTRRGWVPSRAVATSFREAAIALGMTEFSVVEQWCERVGKLEMSVAQQDAYEELKQLLVVLQAK